jgi:hypothetical protein
LNRVVDTSVRVEGVDLLGLVGLEREAAIDALAAGSELPLVIVGGTVVCAGEIDITAIGRLLKGESA